MELKPCPFCGSEKVDFILCAEQNYEDHEEGFIYCHGCGFSSDIYLCEETAAKYWNRRVDNDTAKVCDRCGAKMDGGEE